MTNLMSIRSTPMEQRIGDKICQSDFPLGRFLKISELLIRRIARRTERIRLNTMCKTDKINGFKRENYPNITRFGN